MAPAPPRLRLRKVPVQRLLIGLVAIAAVASALRTARLHPEATAGRAAATPVAVEDTEEEGDRIARPIEAAFAAAKEGHLERYLEQFSEPLRAELGETRAAKGDGYLRGYLSRFTTPINGLVVRIDQQEAIGPGAIRVPVEFVYADRNERQSFSLQLSDGRWGIIRIDTVRAAPTLIPYGTPVEQVR